MKTSYIVHKQNHKTGTEYFYGPFSSSKNAWEWAYEELGYAQLKGDAVLSVKTLYQYNKNEQQERK